MSGSAKPLQQVRTMDSYGSQFSEVNQAINQTLGVAQQNTARSAAEAQILRNWQEQQNQKAMEFNQLEAAKNRDWQQYMSNTAHQREIADLKAAGLNPILSAMGGNGAAVTSGATAAGVTSSGAKGDVDTSASQAIVGLLTNWIASQTQLEQTRMNAQNNLAVAEKYNATSELVARLGGEYGIQQAQIHAAATKYAAKVGADASKVNAVVAAEAAKYGYDLNNLTSAQIATMNNAVNIVLKQMGIQADFDFAERFPLNKWQSNETGAWITEGIDSAVKIVDALTGGRGLLPTSPSGRSIGFGR